MVGKTGSIHDDDDDDGDDDDDDIVEEYFTYQLPHFFPKNTKSSGMPDQENAADYQPHY